MHVAPANKQRGRHRELTPLDTHPDIVEGLEMEAGWRVLVHAAARSFRFHVAWWGSHLRSAHGARCDVSVAAKLLPHWSNGS